MFVIRRIRDQLLRGDGSWTPNALEADTFNTVHDALSAIKTLPVPPPDPSGTVGRALTYEAIQINHPMKSETPREGPKMKTPNSPNTLSQNAPSPSPVDTSIPPAQ